MTGPAALLFAVLLSPLPARAGAPATLGAKFGDWHLEAPFLHDYRVDSERSAQGGSARATEVWATSPDGKARAHVSVTTGLSEAGAHNFILDRMDRVRDLYSRKFLDSPHLRRRKCGPDRKKTVTPAGWRWTLVGFADKTPDFGVCQKEKASYRALALFLHCRDRGTVIEISAFMPVGGAEAGERAALAGARCSK
jgi:hypothetical protein